MAIAPENKEIARVVQKYLIGHSSRKVSFLFWNLVHRKNRILCFVNNHGKDLNIINNPNILVRYVKVKDVKEWELLCDVLEQIVPDNNNYVVRADYLSTYLKKLEFNPDDINVETSVEDSVFYTTAKPSKEDPDVMVDVPTHLAWPLVDLHNEFFMKRWKDLFVPILQKSGNEAVIRCDDIFNDYYEGQGEFGYMVEDAKARVRIPLIEATDLPARKFIKEALVSPKTPPTLEVLTLPGNIRRLMYLYRSDSVDILSTRVYLNIFISS